MNKIGILIAVVAILVVAGFYYSTTINKSIDEPLKGIGTTVYSATTTAPALDGIVQNVASPVIVKTNSGALGSVVVSTAGSAGGRYNLYDATTTDATLRASRFATSSILIASLPTDLAAGTYTFDVAFNYGLVIDWFDGTIGTTTITYK